MTRPFFRSPHRRQNVVNHVVRAGEIRRNHAVPVDGVKSFEASVLHIGAGIADQDVDRSQRRHDLIDDRLDGVPIRDIARGDERGITPANEVGAGPFELLAIAADECDPQIHFRQGLRNALTDPAPGPLSPLPFSDALPTESPC